MSLLNLHCIVFRWSIPEKTPGTLQKGRLSVSVESELPIFLLLKFSPLKVSDDSHLLDNWSTPLYTASRRVKS